MIALLLGLAGFLGVHCVRIVAPEWRQTLRARLGVNGWKALYSVLAAGFFVLLVRGFVQARSEASLLWVPAPALRQVAWLLLALAMILLVATYVPRNAIRARLRHPMLVATALWSTAHLMMSGKSHAVLLFAAFLTWSVAALVSAMRRTPEPVVPARFPMSLLTIAAGIGVYLAMVLWLHRWLIGVAPLPA
ncbi:MAG: NnrU family protein [Pseudoxanthomonas suwonensis]|nr:NnrU family protein [Pseudoxanthomonas suwonensis]